MKGIMIGLDLLALLLLASTLICGLWIRTQPRVEPGSVSFHSSIAVAAILAASAALAISLFAAWRLA